MPKLYETEASGPPFLLSSHYVQEVGNPSVDSNACVLESTLALRCSTNLDLNGWRGASVISMFMTSSTRTRQFFSPDGARTLPLRAHLIRKVAAISQEPATRTSAPSPSAN